MTTLMVETLELEKADGTYEKLLEDHTGRTVQKLKGWTDLQVREVVVPRPQLPGILNYSQLMDSLPKTIEGALFGSDAEDAWDHYFDVAQALSGAKDTDRWLRWTAGGRSLQQKVRLSSFSGPLDRGRDIVEYQCVLRPTDPRSFSQTQQTSTGASLSTAAGGKIYPYTYPRTYNPSSGGEAALTVGGYEATPFIVRIYGYCTAPRVRLASTGQELVFTGEVSDGDYLEVDTAERTVKLNGATDRVNLLDFGSSEWFDLPVGAQTLQLFSSNFNANAKIVVLWRDGYPS